MLITTQQTADQSLPPTRTMHFYQEACEEEARVWRRLVRSCAGTVASVNAHSCFFNPLAVLESLARTGYSQVY